MTESNNFNSNVSEDVSEHHFPVESEVASNVRDELREVLIEPAAELFEGDSESPIEQRVNRSNEEERGVDSTPTESPTFTLVCRPPESNRNSSARLLFEYRFLPSMSNGGYFSEGRPVAFRHESQQRIYPAGERPIILPFSRNRLNQVLTPRENQVNVDAVFRENLQSVAVASETSPLHAIAASQITSSSAAAAQNNSPSASQRNQPLQDNQSAARRNVENNPDTAEIPAELRYYDSSLSSHEPSDHQNNSNIIYFGLHRDVANNSRLLREKQWKSFLSQRNTTAVTPLTPNSHGFYPIIPQLKSALLHSLESSVDEKTYSHYELLKRMREIGFENHWNQSGSETSVLTAYHIAHGVDLQRRFPDWTTPRLREQLRSVRFQHPPRDRIHRISLSPARQKMIADVCSHHSQYYKIANRHANLYHVWKSYIPTHTPTLSHLQLRHSFVALNSVDVVYANKFSTYALNTFTGRVIPVIGSTSCTPVSKVATIDAKYGFVASSLLEYSKINVVDLGPNYEYLYLTAEDDVSVPEVHKSPDCPHYIYEPNWTTSRTNVSSVLPARKVANTWRGRSILDGYVLSDHSEETINHVLIEKSSSDIMTDSMDPNNISLYVAFNSAGIAEYTLDGKLKWICQLPWHPNHLALNKSRKIISVAADCPALYLFDPTSGRRICKLEGHFDYSFASSWHPDPNSFLLASGSQDETVRIWDIRYPKKSLFVLDSVCSEVRSVSFSPDGQTLAVVEALDAVALYNVSTQFQEYTVAEFFGCSVGASFSPDSQKLFIGVAGTTPAKGSIFELRKGSPNTMNYDCNAIFGDNWPSVKDEIDDLDMYAGVHSLFYNENEKSITETSSEVELQETNNVPEKSTYKFEEFEFAENEEFAERKNFIVAKSNKSNLKPSRLNKLQHPLYSGYPLNIPVELQDKTIDAEALTEYFLILLEKVDKNHRDKLQRESWDSCFCAPSDHQRYLENEFKKKYKPKNLESIFNQKTLKKLLKIFIKKINRLRQLDLNPIESRTDKWESSLYSHGGEFIDIPIVLQILQMPSRNNNRNASNVSRNTAEYVTAIANAFVNSATETFGAESRVRQDSAQNPAATETTQPAENASSNRRSHMLSANPSISLLSSLARMQQMTSTSGNQRVLSNSAASENLQGESASGTASQNTAEPINDSAAVTVAANFTRNNSRTLRQTISISPVSSVTNHPNSVNPLPLLNPANLLANSQITSMLQSTNFENGSSTSNTENTAIFASELSGGSLINNVLSRVTANTISQSIISLLTSQLGDSFINLNASQNNTQTSEQQPDSSTVSLIEPFINSIFGSSTARASDNQQPSENANETNGEQANNLRTPTEELPVNTISENIEVETSDLHDVSESREQSPEDNISPENPSENANFTSHTPSEDLNSIPNERDTTSPMASQNVSNSSQYEMEKTNLITESDVIEENNQLGERTEASPVVQTNVEIHLEPSSNNSPQVLAERSTTQSELPPVLNTPSELPPVLNTPSETRTPLQSGISSITQNNSLNPESNIEISNIRNLLLPEPQTLESFNVGTQVTSETAANENFTSRLPPREPLVNSLYDTLIEATAEITVIDAGTHLNLEQSEALDQITSQLMRESNNQTDQTTPIIQTENSLPEFQNSVLRDVFTELFSEAGNRSRGDTATLGSRASALIERLTNRAIVNFSLDTDSGNNPGSTQNEVSQNSVSGQNVEVVLNRSNESVEAEINENNPVNSQLQRRRSDTARTGNGNNNVSIIWVSTMHLERQRSNASHNEQLPIFHSRYEQIEYRVHSGIWRCWVQTRVVAPLDFREMYFIPNLNVEKQTETEAEDGFTQNQNFTKNIINRKVYFFF